MTDDKTWIIDRHQALHDKLDGSPCNPFQKPCAALSNFVCADGDNALQTLVAIAAERWRTSPEYRARWGAATEVPAPR